VSIEDTFPTRRPGLERRQRDNAYIVCAGDEILCELNETGAALFDLCDGSTSPGEIVDVICAMFAVDRKTVEADVWRTLDALGQAGVIGWSRPRAE
jgi:hypothetical protein